MLYGLSAKNQNKPCFVFLGGPPKPRQADSCCDAAVRKVLLNFTIVFSAQDKQRAQFDLVPTPMPTTANRAR